MPTKYPYYRVTDPDANITLVNEWHNYLQDRHRLAWIAKTCDGLYSVWVEGIEEGWRPNLEECMGEIVRATDKGRVAELLGVQ